MVWIVDDSPVEAELARRLLGDHYRTEVFLGGGHLLERLASGPQPDALLLDWNMPELTGLEVCRFIRTTRDRSRLPILVFTATRDEAELVAALSAGANDFVAKPCSAAELGARVAALVEHKRLSDSVQVEAALRERFIGILGHDLRQPLNTLTIGAQSLGRAALGAREARTVKRLASAAARMNRMIADILDLTRSRTGGGLQISRCPSNVLEICRRAVEDMRIGHPTASIVLEESGDAEGEFDGDRLTQMMTNLIANAIEHGASTGPIGVRVAGSDDRVTVSVENAGTPIPPELMAHLFDPFRSGRAPGSTGLGLGLFIVDQIVRGHTGSIGVESDERSTRFTISLPKRPTTDGLAAPSYGARP